MTDQIKLPSEFVWLASDMLSNKMYEEWKVTAIADDLVEFTETQWVENENNCKVTFNRADDICYRDGFISDASELMVLGICARYGFQYFD